MLRSRLDRAFARYARTGEPGALARVFDGSAAELYRLGYHLLGDRHAAEDLVQQTFVVAIEQAKSFERGRPVLPWLCGILTNRALRLRRQARQRTTQRSGALDVVVDPVAEVSAREVSETVAAAVRSLPEPYRLVLMLHLVHELEPKQVAETLARPDATVRTQLARGLDLLRKALPLGIAGLAMGCVPVPIGLSTVRAAVLARAGAEVAVGAVSVATFAGVVAMKKVLLAVVVVLAVLGTWPWWSGDQVPPANVDTGAKVVSVAAATSSVRSAEADREVDRSGADIRVAVPAPDVPTTAALDVAVLWHDGTPAVDVAVRCRPLPLDFELWLRAAHTDGDGVAHFEGLAPGMANAMTSSTSRADVELKAGTTQSVTLTIPRGIDVHGRVVDLDERPIGGATVWMSVSPQSDDSDPAAVTAPDGSFAIRSASFKHEVTATAPGLASARVATVPQTADRELVLVLRPAPGVLIGTVVDPFDRPVADARVLLGVATTSPVEGVHRRSGVQFSNGKDIWPARFAQTDAKGQFRVEGLPPLDWPVWVGAPGFAAAWQHVQVSAIAETHLRFRLSRGATVRGRVTDAEGRAVARAAVGAQLMLPDVSELLGVGSAPFDLLWTQPLWVKPGTRTDENGCYEIGHVATGKLRLLVLYRDRKVQTECELGDGESFVWDAVIADAESKLYLHGVVVDADGNPLDDWWVRNAPPGKGAEAVTYNRGSFRTDPVADSVHRLFVQPREPMVGAEVAVGEFRVADCPLRLVVPREHVPTGSLRGRVVGADGKPDARCSVRFTHSDLRRSGSVSPDAEGQFEARHLQRGVYTVRAESPAFGKVPVGQFQVVDGQITDAGELRIPTPGTLVVTVVDAAGQRLPDARVTVSALAADAWRNASLSHLEGRARGNLPAGRWLIASRNEVTFAAMEVEVRSGETTEVRLVVPDGVPFVLRVPAAAREFVELRQIWRGAEGTTLRDVLVDTYAFAGTDLGWSAPPGRYTLEVVGAGGRKASRTFDLRASTPPQVVELPLPDR